MSTARDAPIVGCIRTCTLFFIDLPASEARSCKSITPYLERTNDCYEEFYAKRIYKITFSVECFSSIEVRGFSPVCLHEMLERQMYNPSSRAVGLVTKRFLCEGQLSWPKRIFKMNFRTEFSRIDRGVGSPQRITVHDCFTSQLLSHCKEMLHSHPRPNIF